MGHEGHDLVDIVDLLLERYDVDQAERPRQRVAHAGRGDIGVRVRDVQRDARRQQPMDDAALGCRRRDAMNGAQEQWVMRDQEVEATCDRLVGDRGHRVDRKQHPAYLSVRVTAHQADRVPGLRGARRIALVECRDDIRESHCSGHVGLAGVEPATSTL